MSNDQNPEIWTGPVIRFVKDNLPVLDHTSEEWDHMCVTAFQYGCDALIAFGQAEETGRGARPLAHPRLPNILPRWDDICITVLSLASQCGLLSYRHLTGFSRKPTHQAAHALHEFAIIGRWTSLRSHPSHRAMMRLLAMIFTLVVMNVALTMSVTHDGTVASQQVAAETGGGQEAEPFFAQSDASCILNGSCGSDETACSWTCAAHGAINTIASQYSIELRTSRLDRQFVRSSWHATKPSLQERPPKALTV